MHAHASRPRRIRWTGVVAVALAATAGGAACASRTGLARSDVLAQPQRAPFRKALVLGMDARNGLREQIERDLAAALGRRGTEAVPASSYFDLSISPPSRDEVRALVAREGFDAVLVARVEPRGTVDQPVPLTAVGVPLFGRPLGFYDYYWQAWPYVYAPAYRERVALGALEVRLYEAGDGRLVFRATSDEFEIREAPRAIESVSQALAKRLAGADLVAAVR